ncbi:MAG: putative hydrolase [Ilumatobacteraceae bacterium]|nr:putative hydrolase [Ilumatobacteraceae bacterium]
MPAAAIDTLDRVGAHTLAGMLEPQDVQRALVITAHPDDVDFAAAGTVANLTDRGVEVTYCLVTDGDAGGFDQTIPRPQMATMRRAEQTRAAKEVGVESLVFLAFGDGRVQYDLVLREALSRVIRQVRPQLVITQSPHLDLARIYGSHPDHVATGQAAIAAVYPDARNPFAYPGLLEEGLEAWTVPEVWVMAPAGDPGPTMHVEDVTDNVDRKIRALMAHETQHQDPSRIGDMVRTWLAATAERFGLDAGRSAEAFLVVETR